jgi:hypothetical protein
VAVIALAAASASADTINFVSGSNNSGQASDLALQLSAEVTGADNGTVTFTFLNKVGIASSVTEIYFKDTLSSLISDPVWDFNAGGEWNVLPGQAMNPGFPPGISGWGALDTAFAADAANNGSHGINAAGETVSVTFTLNGALADLMSTLKNPSGTEKGAVLGLHVRGIGTGGMSDAFCSDTSRGPGPAIPEPSTLVLLGVGLLAASLRMLKRA